MVEQIKTTEQFDALLKDNKSSLKDNCPKMFSISDKYLSSLSFKAFLNFVKIFIIFFFNFSFFSFIFS